MSLDFSLANAPLLGITKSPEQPSQGSLELFIAGNQLTAKVKSDAVISLRQVSEIYKTLGALLLTSIGYSFSDTVTYIEETPNGVHAALYLPTPKHHVVAWYGLTPTGVPARQIRVAEPVSKYLSQDLKTIVENAVTIGTQGIQSPNIIDMVEFQSAFELMAPHLNLLRPKVYADIADYELRGRGEIRTGDKILEVKPRKRKVGGDGNCYFPAQGKRVYIDMVVPGSPIAVRIASNISRDIYKAQESS